MCRALNAECAFICHERFRFTNRCGIRRQIAGRFCVSHIPRGAESCHVSAFSGPTVGGKSERNLGVLLGQLIGGIQSHGQKRTSVWDCAGDETPPAH